MVGAEAWLGGSWVKLTIGESNSTNTGRLCALATHEAVSTALLMNRDERILMLNRQTNETRKAENEKREKTR